MFDKLKLRFIPWDDYSSNVVTSCDQKHLLDLTLKGSNNWEKVINHLTKKWSQVLDIKSSISIFYVSAINSDNNRIISENLVTSYYKRSVYESIKHHPVFKNSEDHSFFSVGESPEPPRGRMECDLSPAKDGILLVELYYKFTEPKDDTSNGKKSSKGTGKRKRESKVVQLPVAEPLSVIDTNISMAAAKKGNNKSAQIPILDDENSSANVIFVKVPIAAKRPVPHSPKVDIISIIKAAKNETKTASNIFSSHVTPNVMLQGGNHYHPQAITVPRIRIPSTAIKSPKRAPVNATPKPQALISEDSLANALFSIVDNMDSEAAPAEAKQEVVPKSENTSNTFDLGAFAMLCDYTANGNNFANNLNFANGNSLVGNDLHFQQLKSPCSNSKSVRFNIQGDTNDTSGKGDADKKRKLFDSISSCIASHNSHTAATPTTNTNSTATGSAAATTNEEIKPVVKTASTPANDNNKNRENKTTMNENSIENRVSLGVGRVDSAYCTGHELFFVPQTGEISMLVKRPVMPAPRAAVKGKVATPSKAIKAAAAAPAPGKNSTATATPAGVAKKKRRITPTFIAHLTDRHKFFIPSNIQ